MASDKRWPLLLRTQALVSGAVARSRDRLEALAEQATAWAGAVVPVVADLERDEDLASATREIMSRSEDVDVLVHSAGAIAFGTFESVSAADFDRQYRVNLRSSRGADANASSRVETRGRPGGVHQLECGAQSILDQYVVRRDETWSEG